MDNKKSVLAIISETRIIHILLTIILGFVVGAFFLLIMGLDVGAAYGRLITSVTSVKGISYVIVYSIPYIMTGLSVAFSFRTGIFNIGAEGQFVLGSMAAACVGILFGSLPSVILIPLCFIAAMLAGALWGAIVGILKNKWGINEVLSMIMFNWIAFYLSNFIAGIPAIHSDGTAEATKNISDNASTLLSKELIADLGLCPTANWGILVALVMMLIAWLIIDKTTLGLPAESRGGEQVRRRVRRHQREPLHPHCPGPVGGHGGPGRGPAADGHGQPHKRVLQPGGLRLCRHSGGPDGLLQPLRRILCGEYSTGPLSTAAAS